MITSCFMSKKGCYGVGDANTLIVGQAVGSLYGVKLEPVCTF